MKDNNDNNEKGKWNYANKTKMELYDILFETFLFSSKGIPSTHQHTDSHPCTHLVKYFYHCRDGLPPQCHIRCQIGSASTRTRQQPKHLSQAKITGKS